MINTKNINWVDTAELTAVRIDKNYGKKETYTSLVLMGIIGIFTIGIIGSFLVINYGEFVISTLRTFLYQRNFFNIFLYVLSGLTLMCFIATLWFSINGIRKTKVGINHQVNTKDNYTLNIISLVFSSVLIFLLIVLTIFRLFIMK